MSKRTVGLLIACVTLLVPTLSIPTSGTAAPRAEGCGLTTLDGTIRFTNKIRSEGKPLECGPGQKIVVRKALVGKAGKPGRRARQTPMKTFFTIADVQLA